MTFFGAFTNIVSFVQVHCTCIADCSDCQRDFVRTICRKKGGAAAYSKRKKLGSNTFLTQALPHLRPRLHGTGSIWIRIKTSPGQWRLHGASSISTRYKNVPVHFPSRTRISPDRRYKTSPDSQVPCKREPDLD